MVLNTLDTPSPRMTDRRMILQFLVLDFLYLCTVYGWTLYQYPLGRDFAAMAGEGALPFGVRTLFAWEVSCFGAWIPGYHLVSLSILYASMVVIFFLTRMVTQGPWWLGSLAAVLFMANPLKSEAILNLSGVAELIPTLLALAAILGYAMLTRRCRWPRRLLALTLFGTAAVPFRANAGLVLLLFLYEGLISPEETRSWRRTLPFLALGVLGWWVHRDGLSAAALAPQGMFAPLYLMFYPIGFLPETAAHFHAHPWLGWGAAALTVAVLVQIARKARSRALVFGLLGAAAMRLFQGDAFVEPVHMIGGGGMLGAVALFSVAVAALSQRVQQHPKWNRPVVVLTTVLCLVLFALQAAVNLAWRRSGEAVEAFQTQAVATMHAHPGETLGIAPDFQYYRGAPMMLSASVAWDTPFSRRVPAVSLLPVNYQPPSVLSVKIEKWTPTEGVVLFEGNAPDLLGYPYVSTTKAFARVAAHTKMEIEPLAAGRLRVHVTPTEGTLPGVLVPWGAARQESSTP
jgi:hypothetical protein